MKKFNSKKIAATFKTKAFKVGGYSVAAAIIVIAIAVAINLLVSKIPTNYTKIDTTDIQLFTISEQTEQIVSGLEDEVYIYWVVQSGSEDANVELLLDRYESLGNNITVIKKDPVVYPNFTSQYTDEDIYNNSLVVVCGDRSRYISANDIYVSDYSNYDTTGEYTTEFDGESCITSAINYVTSAEMPIIYTLTGHGESELSSAFAAAVSNENMDLESLNLLSAGAVPEDADCIFINAPQSDISTDEKEQILAYLEAGGSMLLIAEETATDMPNISALMEYYALEMVDGVVIEGDSYYYAWSYPYYLIPNLNSHEITDPLIDGGYYVLLPITKGVTISEDYRDTLTITQLLTTSDSAYSKTAGYDITTYEKEDGDIDGPFTLGAAVTDTLDTGETKVVWFGTSQLLDDSTNEMVSGANQDIFLNSLAWMCGNENSITIHAKSLSTEYLIVPTASASMLSTLMIGLIPAMFAAAGIAVVVRRNKH